MKLIVDKVLVGFAEYYRLLYLQEHPKVKDIHIGVIGTGMLQGMKDSGDVDVHEDGDGNLVWQVTPKFLAETGLERGPPTVLASGRREH
jgi:hypothetical protein